MKTRLIYLIGFFHICFLSCSKDDSIDTDIEIILTRCFTVKELGTEIPIANAIVVLDGFGTICTGVGCAPNQIAIKNTDSKGEVCFNLTQSENEEIYKITCSTFTHQFFIIYNPPLDFKDIYLEPISD